MRNNKITNKIIILLSATLLITLTSETLFADAWCKARNRCARNVSWKYKVGAYVGKFDIAGRQLDGDFCTDNGCTWAGCGPFNYFENGVKVAHVYAYVGNDNRNGKLERWSHRSMIGTNAGYFFDNALTVNSQPVEGYTYSSFISPVVTISGGGDKGSGIINMQNIDINLASATNSQFGAIFRVIVWSPQDKVDPVMRNAMATVRVRNFPQKH